MTDHLTDHQPSARQRKTQGPAGPLGQWLALEALETAAPDEQPSAAEAALAELLSALPLYSPGSAFAERVLLAARRGAVFAGAAPAPGRWLAHWGVRAAVALCVVQAGLLIAAASSASRPVLGAFEPLGLATATAGILARCLEWLVGLPRLAFGIAELADSAARSLAASPLVMTALFFCLVSSAAGLYLLSAVIPDRREAGA